MSASSTAVANGPPATIPRDEVLNLDLKDILVDISWNSRHFNAYAARDDESTGLDGLVQSIRSVGQTDPIDVVIIPNAAKNGPHYKPLTGFRRLEAIRLINEGYNPDAKDQPFPKKNMTVRALVVADLSPIDARVLNLRENTARNDLDAADIAYGIGEILKIDKGYSTKQLCEKLGLSQSYVDMLKSIVTKTKPEVFKRWRETPGSKVNIRQMYAISQAEPDKQGPMYDELAKAKAEEAPARGPNAWKETAKKRAAIVGAQLGALERDLDVPLTKYLEGEVDKRGDGFTHCVPIFCKVPDELGIRDQKAIGKVLRDAFIAALNTEPDAEEGDEEGETE